MDPRKKNTKLHPAPPPPTLGWTPSRIAFASVLSLGVLVLFLLVPPTKVQADKSQPNTLVNGSPVQDMLADQSYSSAGQQGSIASGFELVDEPAGQEVTLALTNRQESKPAGTKESDAAPAAAPAKAKAEIDWKTVRVSRGDTLTHLFKKAGLTASDAYELLGRCTEAKQLSRIHPGHELDFHIEENKLQTLQYRKSVLEKQVYRRQADRFVAEIVVQEPERRLRYKKASLQNSLFLAGKRAGLDHNVIMQLANVFGGVIDFVYDPRKGDSFSILYEDLYLDGEKIGSGDILAAQYLNSGEAFIAYRYEDSKGNTGYYAPDGVSMQKAFLRAPLDFTRISSNFNLRRFHPIHKRVRAHRGIDYAAPRGTPVFAAGDGRVVKAGYSRANGNYIVINHGPQYTTKYLHLTKRHVKHSKRVKKGQIIGTVGSTGYATGPHLHYEFLVNGVHRNPRTILNKLPKAKSIDKDELPRFQQSIASLQVAMSKHQRAYQLAELDTGSYSLVEPNGYDTLN